MAWSGWPSRHDPTGPNSRLATGRRAGAAGSRMRFVENHTSTPSRSHCRVQPLQFHAGVSRGELPIGFGVLPVAAVLPGGDFLGEGLLVGDAAIETLARQHA